MPKRITGLFQALAPAAILIAAALIPYRALFLINGVLLGLALGHNSPMISGLFALNSSDQYWLSLVVCLAAAQNLVFARILLLYAHIRFSYRRSPEVPALLRPVLPLLLWGWVLLLSVVPAAYFEYQLLCLSNADSWSILKGLLIALGAFLLSVMVENVFSPKGSEQVVPIRFLRDRISPHGAIAFVPRLISRAFAWLILKIDGVGDGFVTPDSSSPNGYRVLSGHILALFCSAALLLFYLGEMLLASFLQSFHMGPGDVKAMIYAILTVALYGAALSFTCFLLDRYRFPVVKSLIFISVVFSLQPLNSHYYEVTAAPPSPPLGAEALWQGSNEQVVVISAQGGGIQAAAWETRVVLGIVEQLPERLRSKFARSIRLISGVSGGSTGAMLVQTLYSDPKFAAAPLEQLHRIHTAGVCGTALSWVGYGLSYHDLTRPILPYFQYSLRDRGWGAEQAWRSILNSLSGQGDSTLSGLRHRVAQGEQPLLVFNATIADLGTPLELANFDFNADPDGNFIAFTNLYPRKDVKLTTAVRLSAAFPLVSPSPRPFSNGRPLPLEQKPFAIVDGGFYDNYGVAGAYFALEQASKSFSHEPPKKIIWIQIRLAGGSGNEPDSLASTIAGPLLVLNNTRSTGQRSRADQLSELAREHLKRHRHDAIQINTFDYPKANAPLSWALTDAQINDVEAGWNTLIHSSDQARNVCLALGGTVVECALKPNDLSFKPSPGVCPQDFPDLPTPPPPPALPARP